MCAELKGFCNPRSPEGKASMIGAPPWYFAEDIMMVNFKVDPDVLLKHIPAPLEPPEVPGLCQLWMTNAVSFSDSERDLLSVNPERTYYKECVVSTACSYKGKQGFLIAYIWVDNDFTMCRGWIQGFPKKLGRLSNSWERRHLQAINPAGLGEFGDGTKVRAWLEAHGERLVDLRATMGRKVTPDELDEPCKMKYLNMLYFPTLEIGADKPLVNQLCESDTQITFGDCWEVKDVSLNFLESEIEELAVLQPKEIISAYLVNIGIQVNGARILHDNNLD